MKPHYYIACLFFLLTGIAEAQTLHFQQYFLSRRNESIQINKIFQSREGYMWFATNKGLFQFDGQSYKSFGIADSLPDLNVTAVAQDSLGRIWTGHATGQISYLSNDRFIAFDPAEGLSAAPVSDILFDDRNVLWFSTLNDGLYYYQRERLYRLDDEDGMPDLYVYDIEIGGEGEIFAGTDGGLVILSSREEKVAINVINNRDGLVDNIVRKVVVLDDHSMLLGTEDKGVIKFNQKNNSFQNLSGNASLGSVSDIVVSSEKAWVASSKSGLTVVDFISGKIKYYTAHNEKQIPVISALWLDAESSIWAGSRSGIFRTLGDELEFIHVPVADGDHNVMAVTHDREGSIWFSTPDGLFKRHAPINEPSRPIESILKGTPYERYRVISLYVDSDGFVWAGLYGEGVLRVNPKSKRIVHISNALRNGNVLNISGGADNTVWLATLGGAERLKIDGEQIDVTHFSTANGLSSDFIYQVFVDSEKRVWFATDGRGVDCLDGKEIKHYDVGLVSKVVYGFAEDASGRIWVNTQDAGIFYWDGAKFKDSKTEGAGFRENNNFVLTSDHAGRIVAMHNSGIDIYDVQRKEIKYLDEKSGLENKAANLNSVSRDSDGNLIFGTSEGIVLLGYNPTLRTFPKVYIDGISIVGTRERLDHTEPLAYSQNNLSINFKGFWYQNPDEVSFMYRMDNYDPEWIHTRDQQVTYSQLPAGDYTFHVRASSGNEETTISFTIRPPFWKTSIFLIFVIVTLAAAIYGYIKYRERALREAKLMLERKVEERTLEIQRNVEEIQAQNEEIMAQAEEIKGINENLEMLVRERTAELERKNKALAEYAFINAHKLRSPVASILGLVNLLNKSEMNDDCKVINRHLLNSADELDDIVRSITKAIERGDHPQS